MPFSTISYNKEGHLAVITLDRPEKGNVVDRQMAAELEEACAQINGDGDVYTVTIKGAGDVFCGGSERDANEGGTGPARSVSGIECPVIAAINGDATGAGLEIALACDIRLAAEGVKFGLPQASQGYIPTDGGTQRLPRIVGKGKALELLLTADKVTAEDALEMGLVSRIVPAESLAQEAQKLAETIAAKGPIALRYLKEAVIKGMDTTLEQGLRLEADLYFLLHTTADRTEGVRAFREKRPPHFKGK